MLAGHILWVVRYGEAHLARYFIALAGRETSSVVTGSADGHKDGGQKGRAGVGIVTFPAIGSLLAGCGRLALFACGL